MKLRKQTVKAVDPSTWRWFGTPGHFICARWCRFHLCTKVGRFLVSTVGEYLHPYVLGARNEAEEAEYLRKNGYMKIGRARKYETMVFRAGKRCSCGCGLPRIAGPELITLPANTAKDASANHYAACLKWSKGAW